MDIKKRKRCTYGPDCGKNREHCGSGTAPIYRYHLKADVVKCLKAVV